MIKAILRRRREAALKRERDAFQARVNAALASMSRKDPLPQGNS